MARRAASAVSVVLACAVLALPAALLASQQPAAAAAGQRAAQPGLSIFITGMTPEWATPSSRITVTGTLRNSSRAQASHLTVELFDSTTPMASVAELKQDASQPYSPAAALVADAIWHSTRSLAPGASTDWSIRVPASALNMTAFGVYPLAAQAQDTFGTALTTTYLPYEPARKGSYASSRPSPAKIAWLWPLIDIPLLNEPWQGNCAGPQASALVQSLGQSGRLGDLVQAAAADDNVTWVVDPAVVANVRALTTCGGSQPRWAKAASVWLTQLQDATSGRPMTVTPYGNPNVAALVTPAVGRGSDVTRSFQLGRSLAGGILHRSLSPGTTSGTTSGTPGSLTEATAIAWSAVGVPGYDTLENLAPAGVRILVLSTSAFPPGQDSVLKTPVPGNYMTALLASQSLTQLLGSSSSAPGSAFLTGQQFLAETALLAQQVGGQQVPAQPIVVAPPPYWDPPAGLAAGLLADTSRAPWLSQVSLTSLASTRHIQIVPNQNWPAGSVGPTRVTRSELRKLRTLDREILQLQGIRAHPDPYLFLAVSALESSAWQGAPKAIPNAMLAILARRIAVQQQGVQIIAEKRITLGGLRGGVPVSIDNHLGYPVRVRLQLQYSQASGIKITADPRGMVTIPPHQTQTVRLGVQATEVGSTTVTMTLAGQGGQPLPGLQRMTIQATQVGVLGVIIFAAALGVFLIASAARAVRRGRPETGADQPASEEPPDDPANDHHGGGSADRAEPDTVMAERTELGAVGKPGP
jgi:hypothetical protein